MELEQRLQELSTLNAIGEILNEEADFSRAIERALERLVDLLGLSTGWVFLTRVAQGDSHQGGFRVAAWTGLPPALAVNEAEPLCSGNCDCQWLFRHGRLDKGVNIVHCSRLEGATGDKGGLEIHASVPLLGRRAPVGILNLAAPGEKHFEVETLEFLTAVGRQLGTAFERSQLLEGRNREARYLATLEERQRLATEMHDSVAQLLFAADLSLRVALQSGDDVQQHEALEKSAELVGSALGELRALVEVLRPADLSEGLVGALSRLAQRTAGVMQVHLELEPVELPMNYAEALYRVAQEALHNALKHAGAQHIWLGLELRRSENGTAVVVRVEDDGTGMAENTIRGVGLGSMAARMEALGGKLEFSPRKPNGLRVEAVIPWRAS